ncbi:cysteine desulfurase family protein [Balneola sp. MJW-20]|uniref:cysteine desulfurase family protein n=1 Tax=Gracilimonas aurantiaca TaxID=3234185 RepID=UPI0034675222
MADKLIYLDYNATTPVDSRVLEEMYPYFNQKFGNASSIHHPFGWDAEEAVELARDKVASLIGARSSEIVFTSGATEAINTAIFGMAGAGDHIITCLTEHKAVLDVCKALEQRGIRVTYLKVNGSGLIDPADLEASISPETRLITIMHSNNETGIIQPIEAISEIAAKYGIPVMTDATQSLGKIPFSVNETAVHMAAFSGHKIYAPKGIGVLYISSELKTELDPLIYGGGHQQGLRSGTLNVPGIVAMGKACEIISDIRESEIEKIRDLRDRMESALLKIEDSRINGAGANRLPNVLNISFGGIDGSRLIRSLKGLAVSQGSACTSVMQEPSHVLKSMGISDDRAFASIRISLGRNTTQEEVGTAVEIIRSAVEKLKLQHQ